MIKKILVAVTLVVATLSFVEAKTIVEVNGHKVTDRDVRYILQESTQ